ncbi:MAG TPA: Rieske 2Fe-2S domain-containing protein [Xanthobacteraceae bacterium]|jgi:nitrite reductase/ring-hydroxylating ferredoxin subunit/DMSO/TMAO reductase YedYZ heme-binding membrane subunit
MSGYVAVQWSRTKYVYDAWLVGGVVLYIAGFMLIEGSLHPPKNSAEWIDLRIRAFGTCAFFMLSIILCIGPLARLNPRFLPLLYNRRHFGVLMFLVACVHAWSMVEWFIVLGVLPSLVDELTNWPNYLKFIGFPFKTLGLVALFIFLLMASTSHDYWLAVLKPPMWKAIHMAVYAAYGLVVIHVALGAMQTNRGLGIPIMLVASLAIVATLHIFAGLRGRAIDRGIAPSAEGWIPVGPPLSIRDKCAKIVAAPGGERIAIFRDGDQVGALSNVCAHQNGPIGEGKIIDGLITCPWHGYQYQLKNGCAPPPFTERVATYRVRLKNGIVELDPRPLAPGTAASIKVPLNA